MSRAVVVAFALLAACSKAPSEADCELLLTHVVELEQAAGGAAATTPEAKAELEAERKKVSGVVAKDFMGTCLKDLPRTQVACGLAATSLDDLAKCDES